MKYVFVTLIVIFLASCTGLPENIEPVEDFNAQKYVGNWYEIARLDHSFERGLSDVSANYTPRKDGGITVVNKGFSNKNNAWKQAEGKAYFVGNETIGHLKVSFFGPFYGSYVIFKLDKKDYQYSYVTSYDKGFLWLLSRTPSVSDAVKKDFLETAKNYGFNVKNIIFVSHVQSSKAIKNNALKQS
jgi:apolipoprotein D and lipocalin family protein